MTGTTPDFAWLFVKMLAGLFLVLVLGYVLIRYVLPRSRFGQLRNIGWARVVARFPLEARKHLLVVKIEEKYLLLGVSETQVSYLKELERSEGEKIEAQNSS